VLNQAKVFAGAHLNARHALLLPGSANAGGSIQHDPHATQQFALSVRFVNDIELAAAGIGALQREICIASGKQDLDAWTNAPGFARASRR
jgi:hypothetical protein